MTAPDPVRDYQAERSSGTRTRLSRHQMTWQQKAEALNTLSHIAIHMRGIEDWFVHQKVEVTEGGVLAGRYGNGKTPQMAIENHWFKLVENLAEKEYLVTNAMDGSRRAYLWSGFMWKEIDFYVERNR